MSATTSKPYDWLRHIPRSLLELDDVPLFGVPIPFPWDELVKSLGIELKLEGLHIEATDAQWLENEQLFQNLGDDLAPLNFMVSGLEGSLCWVMPKDELKFLTSKLLEADGEELDPDFEESLYRFLGYQVISTIGHINWDKTLSIHILNKKEMPAEASFCVDVKASWNEHAVTGRLIISPSFQKAWKERFAARSMDLPALRGALAEEIETTLHLEVGRTSFTPKEWEQVKAGDFVLLEACSLKEGGGGRVNLTVKGIPFYTGSFKNGSIKIEEHPDFREVDATMEDEPKNEEDFEDEFEDFEDEDFKEDDFEDDIAEGGEADTEDEFKDAEEPITEESFEEEPLEEEPIEEAPKEEVPEEKVEAALIKEEGPPVSPKELPMAIVVEVGRIKMSIQKLMELQPGNVLDLSINPEDGVDLTVNGKRIAKAELLRVGETLGVRILDIG